MIKFQIVFLSVVEDEALIWPLLSGGKHPVSPLLILLSGQYLLGSPLDFWLFKVVREVRGTN